MNVILFYQHSIPRYIEHTFRQLQFASPKDQIYLITDQKYDFPGVITVNMHDLQVTDVEKFTYFRVNPDPFTSRLFHTSALRFFYIHALMKTLNGQPCFTFDCDVLVYQPLVYIHTYLHQDTKIAITPHYSEEYVCGMMYIRNSDALTPVVDRLERFMYYTEQQLQPVTGIMPHEMRLLKLISDECTPKFQLLPTLPTESTSLIYDPGSYGIWLDGKYIDRTPGDFYDHYDIGRALACKDIHVTFDKRNGPIVHSNHEKHSLANLHIHTKNLDKFITYE